MRCASYCKVLQGIPPITRYTAVEKYTSYCDVHVYPLLRGIPPSTSTCALLIHSNTCSIPNMDLFKLDRNTSNPVGKNIPLLDRRCHKLRSSSLLPEHFLHTGCQLWPNSIPRNESHRMTTSVHGGRGSLQCSRLVCSWGTCRTCVVNSLAVCRSIPHLLNDGTSTRHGQSEKNTSLVQEYALRCSHTHMDYLWGGSVFSEGWSQPV